MPGAHRALTRCWLLSLSSALQIWKPAQGPQESCQACSAQQAVAPARKRAPGILTALPAPAKVGEGAGRGEQDREQEDKGDPPGTQVTFARPGPMGILRIGRL